MHIDRRSGGFSICRSRFQDGGDDVISRRNVLPPGECTRSVESSEQLFPPTDTNSYVHVMTDDDIKGRSRSLNDYFSPVVE